MTMERGGLWRYKVEHKTVGAAGHTIHRMYPPLLPYPKINVLVW